MNTTLMPWYIAGPSIAMVMFALLKLGKSFGVSSNLRTMCSILGAGKRVSFFDFDWKAQLWNFSFVLGAVVGGWISATFFRGNETPSLSESGLKSIEQLGFTNPDGILPVEIFAMNDFKSVAVLVIGGLLIGFGSRYAGGCTSGHAISGLSNFQLPSLIAVIGFFIGGLLMTHFVLPWIF